jgi:hypothetical protein
VDNFRKVELTLEGWSQMFRVIVVISRFGAIMVLIIQKVFLKDEA